MSKRALFFVNRNSRRGAQLVGQAQSILESLGFELEEQSTEVGDELPEIIRRRRAEVDLAIIGGGDGTLNHAAEGLVATGLPLGILPLGTANDLAGALHIPLGLPDACQIIAGGHVRPIDVGSVNGKYFLNDASFGISANIARRLTKDAKRRFGIISVASVALRVLLHARPMHVEMRTSNEVFRLRSLQITVGNGRRFGGLVANKDAEVDDRRLEVYSVEVRHWWHVFRMLPALLQGRYGDCPGVRTLHGSEFELHTRRPRRIYTDGERTTQTPAAVRIFPKALSVFVPEAEAAAP